MPAPAPVTRTLNALGGLTRARSARVVAGVLAVFAAVALVVAYRFVAGTVADVAATCRDQPPEACQAAAQAGEERVIADGPRVLGTEPATPSTVTLTVDPDPLPPRVITRPGEVTTLPPLPGRTVVAPPAPPVTVEKTVTRESTVAGRPTRVTETVTEAAPPPRTVIVERTETRTVTVPADPPTEQPPSSGPAPTGEPAAPTALPGPGATPSVAWWPLRWWW